MKLSPVCTEIIFHSEYKTKEIYCHLLLPNFVSESFRSPSRNKVNRKKPENIKLHYNLALFIGLSHQYTNLGESVLLLLPNPSQSNTATWKQTRIRVKWSPFYSPHPPFSKMDKSDTKNSSIRTELCITEVFSAKDQ